MKNLIEMEQKLNEVLENETPESFNKWIIEKRQAIAQNDINHFNQRISEIENEISKLNMQKNSLMQKISKKHVWINQLEADKSKIED